jgi:hypothetical protein
MDKSWEEEEVQGKKVKNPNVGGGARRHLLAERENLGLGFFVFVVALNFSVSKLPLFVYVLKTSIYRQKYC